MPDGSWIVMWLMAAVGVLSGLIVGLLCRKPRMPNAPSHICTAQNPWRPDLGKAEHPDAAELGPPSLASGRGAVQSLKCPHCGLVFERALRAYSIT